MQAPPGPNVPFPPMEAELVEELPRGEHWQYEPKWDGFRGVLENDGGTLALWSRNGRPLLRYFPELAKLGELLPPHSALDGEVVIETDGKLDFDALQMRLHPAESRIRKLAAERPAGYIAFDILLWDGKSLHDRPLRERRRELERRAKKFQISPVTSDAAVAADWLKRLEAAGLDGVIAKRTDLAYMPGSRDAVVKVKHHRTVDCVIVGFRWSTTTKGQVSTLLLGLYRDDGTLDFVGHSSGFPAPVRAQLAKVLPPLIEGGHLADDARIPGAESRWSRGKELAWEPLKPTLVCEVRFDKLEADRFRHGTRFLRFRPDKDPRDCAWTQVRPKPRKDDLTVPRLLGR